MSKPLHDSRRPLANVEAGSIPRSIGVLVSGPFWNHGLERRMVDVERETVAVNSRTFGNMCAVERAEQVVREATQRTIEDLDRVIADLTQHRERLAGELAAGFEGLVVNAEASS